MATSTVWGCTLSDTAWGRSPVAFPETSHGCCIFYLKAVYDSSMQQVCRYAWHKVSRNVLVAFTECRFQQVLGYEKKKKKKKMNGTSTNSTTNTKLPLHRSQCGTTHNCFKISLVLVGSLHFVSMSFMTIGRITDFDSATSTH